MRPVSTFTALAAVAAILAASPALADPGKGRGQAGHSRLQVEDPGHNGRGKQPSRASVVANCPPGLAKKNPPCVPPGQARKQAYYGNRVGDILRIGDYAIIRDPRRYDLRNRDGWNYYRDEDRIYRVDSSTQRILAVLNLIDAFSN
ncbi:hypothetical protein [Paracoccus salsus]|uniref:hypothetical protein n=1 Tax=Paracoccus salsus TaxID=2911061 RepID=UPI001F1CC5AF|nr:hypothetical protein [Paracoccus salsus]MCF3974714.1 hypothetical protein [Paracoccus salsus]